MDLLAELNRLREKDGKAPLKKWTGTEAQLKRAILDRRKLRSPQKTDADLVAEYLKKGGDVKVGREASARGVRRQGGNKKRRVKIFAKKPRIPGMNGKRAPVPGEYFTLSELAKAEDRKATKIRSLARIRPELEPLRAKDLGRWVFRREDWDLVCSILWPSRQAASDLDSNR